MIIIIIFFLWITNMKKISFLLSEKNYN